MTTRTFFRYAFGWLAVSAAAAVAHASITINFDDVTTDTGIDSITPVPGGYGGIDQWSNWDVISADAYPGTGYAAGVVSGDYAAFNAYGQPAILSAAVPFDLDSVELTASNDASDDVEVTGYLAGNPVYDTTVVVNDLAPTLATLSFNDIDTVEFTNADPGESFVADNLTVSAVPEPAALSILGSIVLLSLRRRG